MMLGSQWLRMRVWMWLGLGLMTLLTNGVEAQKTQDEKCTVTSIITVPYLMLKSSKTPLKGNDRFEGFIKDLLDALTADANIQCEIRLQTGYGAVFPNGTWGGMVGDLVNRKTDMVLAPLTETLVRSKVIEFGKHFQTFGRVAIVKKWPKDDVTHKSIRLDVRLGRLFAPLDDSVWLLSGLAWFVASLVLYIICRINPFEWRRMAKDREATLREGEAFNCVNSYWFMLSAIFWQGFMRAPRSIGARVVVTFWWLYALIFVSMYIASLTNYLQSVPQLNEIIHNYTRIQSLNDILEDVNIKVAVIENSATETYFQHSSGFNFNAKIWDRIVRDKSHVRTFQDGIEAVRKSTREEPYVFFAESTMSEYTIRQPPCDLFMIPDFPFLGSYAPAFPINSNLRIPMEHAMYKFRESGRLRLLEKKWFTGYCDSHYIDTSDDDQPKTVQYPKFQRVDLASFSGALILLIIGLAAGSLITVVEILIFKYTGKNESEHQMSLTKDKKEKSSKSEDPMTDV